MIHTLSIFLTLASILETMLACELDVDRLCPTQDSEENSTTPTKRGKNEEKLKCDPVTAAIQQLDDLGRTLLDLYTSPLKILTSAFTENEFSSETGNPSSSGASNSGGSGESSPTSGSGTREPVETHSNNLPPVNESTAVANTGNPQPQVVSSVTGKPGATVGKPPSSEGKPILGSVSSEKPQQVETPASGTVQSETVTSNIVTNTNNPPPEAGKPPTGISPLKPNPEDNSPEMLSPVEKPPPEEKPPSGTVPKEVSSNLEKPNSPGDSPTATASVDASSTSKTSVETTPEPNITKENASSGVQASSPVAPTPKKS